jgi:hypothetical protein
MTAEHPGQNDDAIPHKPSDAAYHHIYADPRMVEDTLRQCQYRPFYGAADRSL